MVNIITKIIGHHDCRHHHHDGNEAPALGLQTFWPRSGRNVLSFTVALLQYSSSSPHFFVIITTTIINLLNSHHYRCHPHFLTIPIIGTQRPHFFSCFAPIIIIIYFLFSVIIIDVILKFVLKHLMIISSYSNIKLSCQGDNKLLETSFTKEMKEKFLVSFCFKASTNTFPQQKNIEVWKIIQQFAFY